MSRARLALAVERASVELRRRQRLADTDTVEDATTRFLGTLFRAQGEAFGSGPVASVRAADARWRRASDETRPAFTRGITAALRAAMAVGAWRTLRGVGAMEAVTFVAPPATRDLIPEEFRFERGRDRRFAVLAGTPFDLDNPRATRWLEQHAATLVKQVDGQTRDLIRGIVTGGVDGGWSSERIGKGIKALFPEMAVGRPQQHIDSRAHGIAVTEMAYGYEQGSRLGVDRLEAAGLRVVKSWLTVGDERVDDACTANGGADEIALRDPFPSGDQMPPAHPYCRCTTEYRVLAKGERPDIQPPVPVPGSLPAPVPAPVSPRAAVPLAQRPPDGWTVDSLKARGITFDGADKIDPALASKVMDTLVELQRDVPRFDEVLAFVRTSNLGERTYAKAVSNTFRGASRIELNARLWRDRKRIEGMLADDVLNGFHPKVLDDIKAVVDHEFGHTLHFSPIYGSRIDSFLNTLKDRMPQLYSRGVPRPKVPYNSEYARQNRHEWWSELFAEARSGKPFDDLSEPAKVTRTFLADLFGDEAARIAP